jgi:diaminopimelate decarboxylase
VTSIKGLQETTWVGVNSGMNHLIRPCLYQAYHDIRAAVDRPEKATVQVCGNLCETGDILGRDRGLPLPREGDLLTVCNAGAYCFSMASNYNSKPRPCEVLVQEGRARVIRRRESLEEMLGGVVWGD